MAYSTIQSETMSHKSTSICLKVIPLGFFLLFLQPLHSQDWTNLNSEVQARQKQLGNNLVLMIWKGDTIAYKKELGDFNSKTQAPLGGSSRWLTAALVMIMVDEGKVSLDDKVSRYLPEYERYGKNYITLRLCLANMTGISDKKKYQEKKFASLEDEVNSYAAREIRTNPGEDFWYGGIGAGIAGRVLEIVSKKRFDVLVKQKLFNPLTMRRTTFSTLDASATDPAEGALSTPDDYMQFLVMLLNKGKYKGRQIVTEESVNELMQLQTKPELMKSVPESMQGSGYALGSWVVGENNGKASAFACPSFSGTWPMIDYCRDYAYLLFVKKPDSDPKSKINLDFKGMIDQEVNCK